MISISTKSGDKGESGLANGSRLGKDALIFEVLGTLDELNSWIGLSLTAIDPSLQAHRDFLFQIQDTLFYIGAELAASPKATFDQSQLKILDKKCTDLQQSMEDSWVTKFLLPGGTSAAAHLDVTRCVCRRVERLIVALHKTSPVRPELLAYINRLSDYFYVLRCLINLNSKYQEHPFDASYTPFFK